MIKVSVSYQDEDVEKISTMNYDPFCQWTELLYNFFEQLEDAGFVIQDEELPGKVVRYVKDVRKLP